MKKEKKSQPKPKEFSTAPFKELKGVRLEQESKPARVVPKKEQPPASVNEEEVFLRAMANVRRLEHSHTEQGGVPKPGQKGDKPTGRFVEEDRRTFQRAMENLQLDVDFRDELPDDVVPLRPLPVNRLRQLKRGALRIELELDLHGMNREEALASLEHFISGAHKRGQQVVLVITGKGNNSPDEPVLQRAVSGWLRDRGKGMVAEFAPAPRQLGGSGAFVVFLKVMKCET